MRQIYTTYTFAAAMLVAPLVSAQILPKNVEHRLQLAGLEYFDHSEDGWRYANGKDYSFFDYDYVITSPTQDIMVDILLPGEERYIDMAKTIRSIAVQARNAEIDWLGGSSSLCAQYQVDQLMVADFRPRAFFKRSRCQLIGFITDTGAYVRIATFYAKELSENNHLRAKH